MTILIVLKTKKKNKGIKLSIRDWSRFHRPVLLLVDTKYGHNRFDTVVYDGIRLDYTLEGDL